MQKVNFFNYLTNWRIPKWHWGGDRQAGMPAQSGSFHPGNDKAAVCTHLLKACTRSLPPCSDLLCAFYDPQDRELKHVCESVLESLKTSTITSTWRLFSKQAEDKQQWVQYVKFPTVLFSRPWHSQLQGHLSESTILLTIFLLLTISSQLLLNQT